MRISEEQFEPSLVQEIDKIKNKKIEGDLNTLYPSTYVDGLIDRLKELLNDYMDKVRTYVREEVDTFLTTIREELDKVYNESDLYTNKQIVEFISVIKYQLSKTYLITMVYTKKEIDDIVKKYMQVDNFIDKDKAMYKTAVDKAKDDISGDIYKKLENDYLYTIDYINKKYGDLMNIENAPDNGYSYTKKEFDDLIEEFKHINALTKDQVYDKEYIDALEIPDWRNALRTDDNFYTKQEINAIVSEITNKLSHKLDTNNVYTNQEIDNKRDILAEIQPPNYSNFYVMQEIDDILSRYMLKANSFISNLESYSITEILAANCAKTLVTNLELCRTKLLSEFTMLYNTLKSLDPTCVTSETVDGIILGIKKYGGYVEDAIDPLDHISSTNIDFLSYDYSSGTIIGLVGDIITMYNQDMSVVQTYNAKQMIYDNYPSYVNDEVELQIMKVLKYPGISEFYIEYKYYNPKSSSSSWNDTYTTIFLDPDNKISINSQQSKTYPIYYPDLYGQNGGYNGAVDRATNSIQIINDKYYISSFTNNQLIIDKSETPHTFYNSYKTTDTSYNSKYCVTKGEVCKFYVQCMDGFALITDKGLYKLNDGLFITSKVRTFANPVETTINNGNYFFIKLQDDNSIYVYNRYCSYLGNYTIPGFKDWILDINHNIIITATNAVYRINRRG